LLPYDAFVVRNDNGNGNDNRNQQQQQQQENETPLWFAACSHSKPGFPNTHNQHANATSIAKHEHEHEHEHNADTGTPTDPECWTLVSTPTFAVEEITETTLRDPVTGAFRPQENGYLNSGPGPKLRDAFFELVRPYLAVRGHGHGHAAAVVRAVAAPNDENGNNNDDDDGTKTNRGAARIGDDNDEQQQQQQQQESEPPLLSVLYLQAQRWGSGLPIDPERVPEDHVQEICGTRYASKTKGSLVYNTDDDNDNNNDNDDQQQQQRHATANSYSCSYSKRQNFVADDEQGLYYCGDFCSNLNPGFEAAALSGLDLAEHIARNQLV